MLKKTISILLGVITVVSIYYFFVENKNTKVVYDQQDILSKIEEENCSYSEEISTKYRNIKASEDWYTFESDNGFIFKYPKDKVLLNDLNVDEDGFGIYEIYLPPTGAGDGPTFLVTINVEPFIDIESGFAHYSVFNNQNPISAQIKRFISDEDFWYYPCPAVEGQKLTTWNDDILRIFTRKNNEVYVQAYASMQEEYFSDYREIQAGILNSISFE